jgi:hypothetical protein
MVGFGNGNGSADRTSPRVPLMLGDQLILAECIKKVKPCLTLRDLIAAIHVADTLSELNYGL